MKIRLQLLTLLLLTAFLIPSQAQAQKKKRPTVEELTTRIDSLQRAYDSLSLAFRIISEAAAAAEDTPAEEIVDYQEFVDENEYTPESIDSLLSIYYIQKNMDANEINPESIDRDTLTSVIPDSVYIARLEKMNSFIPLTFNRYVKNSIIRYTEKIPLTTQKVISLSTYYLPIFEEIFDEYGLPKELKAMAMIESAFNPKAVSRAKAKGMWQFMYVTAKQYGLQMTSFVDERFDPVESCRAAAKYLRDSYMVFGDWSLAIASYNCGLGNVSKAIRRSGGKTDFWGIYEYLPRETRGYVPIFIAALYMLQYYPEHGMSIKPISLPAHVDTIHVNKMLHFQQIADNIGISVEALRDINPQYLHDIIPGTEREYVLRLPHNYTMAFVDKEDEIYAYKDSIFFNKVEIEKIESGNVASSNPERIIHKVKRGESLGSLARKYNTTVSNIKKWNHLRSNTIQIGQKLAIYGSAGGGTTASASSSSSGSSSSAGTTTAKPASSSNSGGDYVMYTIKKGDTLTSIAKRNGVSLNTLLKSNNLTTNSKIYPGMKIRIKKA